MPVAHQQLLRRPRPLPRLSHHAPSRAFHPAGRALQSTPQARLLRRCHTEEEAAGLRLAWPHCWTTGLRGCHERDTPLQRPRRLQLQPALRTHQAPLPLLPRLASLPHLLRTGMPQVSPLMLAAVVRRGTPVPPSPRVQRQSPKARAPVQARPPPRLLLLCAALGWRCASGTPWSRCGSEGCSGAPGPVRHPRSARMRLRSGTTLWQMGLAVAPAPGLPRPFPCPRHPCTTSSASRSSGRCTRAPRCCMPRPPRPFCSSTGFWATSRPSEPGCCWARASPQASPRRRSSAPSRRSPGRPSSPPRRGSGQPQGPG